MEVVPTQLFFGSVTRGNKVIRQLELRFTTLADLPDPNRLAFQHDFGSALALELERAQGKVWILSASYCPGPDEQTGIVRGRVVLDFAYTNKHNVADIKMRDQRLKSVKAVNVSQCIEQSQLSHTTPKYESVEFEVMARILK